MKHACALLVFSLLTFAVGAAPIDRQALVTRHNITWNDPAGRLPLGNGEFCFTTDATGLQTFGGNAMAHWGWHSFPLPEGWTPERVPATGTFQKGRNQGPDVFPKGTEALRKWLFDNPHSFSFARLRLVKAGGAALQPDEIKELSRTLDLWAGTQSSSFKIGGQPVTVTTCVHPDLDLVATRIESPLLARGELEVALDFPYPALNNKTPWVGDFAHPEGHKTITLSQTGQRIDFRREIDATTYHVTLAWSAGSELQAPAGDQVWRLIPRAGTPALELSCAFSAAPVASDVPGFETTRQACAAHWKNFWSTGGAIDLSQSKDPRWKELERRIVLSQYQLAAQSAGSYPSAETGLLGIDNWRGQFHMEMVWWHLAHYALWDRWALADRALGCYTRFAPAARALAGQLNYAGLKWGKSVGPEGRSAPWAGNQVLLWKQPHPIFFAELDYRLHPGATTLKKWQMIVEGTAEHMADYATRDAQSGLYHLAPAMPPSEQGITRDTVFDLAYWRWGLDAAQRWRERLGLAHEPRWDEVRAHLAPLPEEGGVFMHSAEWHDTYGKRAYEHPDPVGVLGMLPPIAGVDAQTAHRTVRKVWTTWNWNKCWGWDFPWMAMAAARTGEPEMAVEALLKESPRNVYGVDGVNTGGPCPYLPGNGGLLYAAAMMAAGWDGAPSRPAPGFPAGGAWVVRWEGLQPAP